MLIRTRTAKTKNHQVKILGNDYFKKESTSAEERMAIAQNKSADIEPPELYGIFRNDQHYLDTLEVLASSTTEASHKEQIFEEVILNLSAYHNLLDIGVGIGDFTYKVASYFENTTIVDKSIEALNNVPNEINGKFIHKIEGSILDKSLDIYHTSYDMILLSHVLYYIPKDERIPLINDLHSLLTDSGVIVITFNDEGDRLSLGKHFGSVDLGFSELHSNLPNLYNSFSLYRVEEFFDGGGMYTMMHIAGISLNDYGVNATETDLSSFLANYCPHNVCQMSTIQNIMVLGDLDDS